MTRRTGLIMLAAVGLAVAGCATSGRHPANARMKTCGGPLVQAHRGGRFEYDDNALGGFEKCLAQGVKGFELDVRFTRDHVLVVMHDADVARTTDGRGVVETMDFADIRKLRLKKSSEQVPTLSEVLAAMSGRNDVFVEIEMKARPDSFYTEGVLEDYCRKLDETAKGLMKPGTYAFTCFSAKVLAAMRRVDHDAPLCYIVGKPLEDAHIATALELGCCGVSPRVRTTKEMVEKAHAAGLAVCLWMCQDKATWDDCAAKGVDRVTSDHPIRLTGEIRAPSAP
ncbi:MAG: hypothetical protein IJI73_02965 [Kiritimatiellae bacterium]|nr:hypothetical protein [Kiritimatiellia bacterium]